MEEAAVGLLQDLRLQRENRMPSHVGPFHKSADLLHLGWTGQRSLHQSAMPHGRGETEKEKVQHRMIILERGEEFHQHLNECNRCTAGARTLEFCFVGRLMIQAAAAEAALLDRRAAEQETKKSTWRVTEAPITKRQGQPARKPGLPPGLRDRAALGTGEETQQ